MTNNENNAEYQETVIYVTNLLKYIAVLKGTNEVLKEDLLLTKKRIAQLEKGLPPVKLVPVAPVYNFNIN